MAMHPVHFSVDGEDGMQKVRFLVLVAVLSVVCFLPAKVCQAADRTWDEGTVWTIHFAKSKPGKFTDYIGDINTVFKKYAEELKKEGVLVSYRVLENSFPREAEADVIVLMEYPNMAAFDRGAAFFDSIVERVLGSLNAADKAEIDREQLRTLKGTILARELRLRN